MYEADYEAEVIRIERVGGEKVRLTLVPVYDPETQPRPWSERYLIVPLEDEVPTGTRFQIHETYEREQES